MRNTSWAKVQPGQIIYFTYKSKHDDVGYPRTVLVLNPKLRYKKKSTNRSKYYLVGLILDTRISRGLTAGQLKKLFGRIGGVEIRDDSTFGANLSEGQTPETTGMIYERVEELVDNYDIWRTFDLGECRKRRVYLEEKWNKLPESQVKLALAKKLNEEEVDDALTQERKQKKREEVDRKLKKDLKNTKNAAQREMKFEADKVFVTKQFIKRVIEGLG